jgi:CHAD domain-containing protein
MVQMAWAKFAKDVRNLSYASPSIQWHQARIRAKRARYTADAAAAIAGKYMRLHAQHMAEVTDILGDLHDAHVAELFLRDLADAPHVTGREGLALGRLLDLQQHLDEGQRRKFAKVWPTVRKAARDAGLT